MNKKYLRADHFGIYYTLAHSDGLRQRRRIAVAAAEAVEGRTNPRKVRPPRTLPRSLLPICSP